MRALVSAFVLCGTLLLSSPVLAEDTPAEEETTSQTEETPAEERATQFVGVKGPDAESVPGGALLLAAYAVIWVLLFLFLMRMRRLQQQTAEELERLSVEIRASEGR